MRYPASVAVFAIALIAFAAAIASAQSNQRPAPGTGNAGSSTPGANGSATQRPLSPIQDMVQAPVALRGFCPVCLVEMKQWVKGDPQFRVVVDGKSYFFPDQKRKDMFQAAPVKYVPALGGDCPIHFALTRRRVAGDLKYGLVHDGRLYFFSSDEHRRRFFADATPFANLDLALAGQCVVCRRDMNQNMPGRPELTVVHGGLRYQFAGLPQRDAFLSNPAVYEAVAATSSAHAPAPGSGTATGSGTSNGSAARPPASGSWSTKPAPVSGSGTAPGSAAKP